MKKVIVVGGGLAGLSAGIKLKQDKDLRQRLYYDLGNVYMQLADVSRAKEAYLEATEIDPRSNLGLKAKFNLAWAHKYLRSYDQAIAYFDEIYNHYPTRIIGILSQYQVADIFYKKYNPQIANL